MRQLIAALLVCTAPVAALAAEGSSWTLLTLRETAQASVPADRTVARLRLEQRGEDARAVQAEVNRLMAAALTTAQGQTDVTVEGGGYSVYASQPDPEGKAKPVWTAVQELTLTGGDAGKVLALAGQLQDQGFLFSDLAQQLSPDKQREARDGLLKTATARLRATAEATAAGLGLRFAGWSRVSLDGGGQGPRPLMRMAVAADAMAAAPPATADADIEVEVTLEGEARLVALE